MYIGKVFTYTYVPHYYSDAPFFAGGYPVNRSVKIEKDV